MTEPIPKNFRGFAPSREKNNRARVGRRDSREDAKTQRGEREEGRMWPNRFPKTFAASRLRVRKTTKPLPAERSSPGGAEVFSEADHSHAPVLSLAPRPSSLVPRPSPLVPHPSSLTPHPPPQSPRPSSRLCHEAISVNSRESSARHRVVDPAFLIISTFGRTE